jgi:hypothetical protein
VNKKETSVSEMEEMLEKLKAMTDYKYGEVDRVKEKKYLFEFDSMGNSANCKAS